jgi:hypothetical protein
MIREPSYLDIHFGDEVVIGPLIAAHCRASGCAMATPASQENELRAEVERLQTEAQRPGCRADQRENHMRDLTRYPITTQEIIECLRQFKADCDPHLIGDMRPLLLEKAIEAVRADTKP